MSKASDVINSESEPRDAVGWRPVWRSNEELLRFADLTLAEFFRQNARYGSQSRLLEENGLVLFAGSHPQPNPYRNGAIRLDHRLSASKALDQAHPSSNPLDRPFAFRVPERATAPTE